MIKKKQQIELKIPNRSKSVEIVQHRASLTPPGGKKIPERALELLGNRVQGPSSYLSWQRPKNSQQYPTSSDSTQFWYSHSDCSSSPKILNGAKIFCTMWYVAVTHEPLT